MPLFWTQRKGFDATFFGATITAGRGVRIEDDRCGADRKSRGCTDAQIYNRVVRLGARLYRVGIAADGRTIVVMRWINRLIISV